MSTKRILCKYFMHGACLKGEACEFSHIWADPSNNACTFYQKGVCSYGSRCRYDHVKLSRSEGTTVLPNASAASYDFPARYGAVFEEQSQSPIHDGGVSVSFQPSMPSSINVWRQQPDEYVPYDIQEQSQSPVQDGGVSVSFQPSIPSSINAWRQQPEEYVPFDIQEQSQSPVQDGGVSVSFQPSIPSSINAWRQQPEEYVPFDIQRLQSLTTSSFRDQAEKPICAAFAAGRCAHGNSCPHLHGDLCPICGKHCLHPFRPSEREEHQKQCERNQKRLEALRHSQEIECCVCLERVLSKPTVAERKFGLLSSCDHAFCISCIRDWRSNTHAPGMDVDTVVRACPVCRVVSHYVIPSVIWYLNPEEKEEIVNGYKAKLSTIDCRYFDFGNGSCPFGTSCFYKHAYRDGHKEETKLRHLAAADGGTIIAKNVRLSDFLGRLNLRG